MDEVASRLLGLSRFSAAAEHFRAIDKMNEALDCYLRVGDWAGAQRLCEQHAPELLPRFERAQQASAFGQQQAQAQAQPMASSPSPLAAEAKGRSSSSSYTPSASGSDAKLAERKESKLSSGDDSAASSASNTSALDAWMQRGEWDKVLSSAAKHGPQSLAKYLVLRVARPCEHEEVAAAVKTLADYGVPVDASAIDVVSTAVRQALGGRQEVDAQPGHATVLAEFAKCLRKLVKDLRGASGSDVATSRVAEVEQWLLMTHYFVVKHQSEGANGSGLDDVAARVSMSLLRFIGPELPADKMFYLAGAAARSKKWLSAAFVFFNRYLDLCEAIDESGGSGGDASLLDNTDFVGADIPTPADFPLPETHYVGDEGAREEIRDWVLTISMDQQVAEKLPERACGQCKAQIYEAALACPECRVTNEACILTGFPVAPKNTAHCATCKVIADRDMWNRWVKHFGYCPWCQAPQKMSY